MAGMQPPQVLEVTAAKQIHFDSIEAIPNYALRLNATWDRNYGHAARGTFVYVADKTKLIVRPIGLAVVTAVNGNSVTVARGAALDNVRLAGKTLTKLAPDGTITELEGTVVAVTNVNPANEFKPQWDDSIVTFSDAPGLAVGDVIGSEGLTAELIKAEFDGLIYESRNSDLDPQTAVAVEIKARTELCIGAAGVAALVPNRVRVRDDITFVACI